MVTVLRKVYEFYYSFFKKMKNDMVAVRTVLEPILLNPSEQQKAPYQWPVPLILACV